MTRTPAKIAHAELAKQYQTARRNHAKACVGEFCTFQEFTAETATDRNAYVAWLRKQSRDIE